jgi:AcrR family transcriptional regulator
MMMSLSSNEASAVPSRLDRRKARTRQALVDAAIRLIALGRAERASVQEITDAADIGFGSFYNHFDSKDALFRTAFEEMLERWGQMIDHACAGMEDPAEVVAASVRMTGRLCWSQPEVAQFLVGAGLDVLDAAAGLAPRARRDINAGLRSGRFRVPDADLALNALGGGLLALLRLRMKSPHHVHHVAVDQFAELMLRMLGVPESDAARIARMPLPEPHPVC